MDKWLLLEPFPLTDICPNVEAEDKELKRAYHKLARAVRELLEALEDADK